MNAAMVNPAWEKAENLARAAELKAAEPKASPALKASAKALRAKADALKANPPTVAPSGAAAVTIPPKAPEAPKAPTAPVVAPKAEGTKLPTVPAKKAPKGAKAEAAPKAPEAPKPEAKAAEPEAPKASEKPQGTTMDKAAPVVAESLSGYKAGDYVLGASFAELAVYRVDSVNHVPGKGGSGKGAEARDVLSCTLLRAPEGAPVKGLKVSALVKPETVSTVAGADETRAAFQGIALETVDVLAPPSGVTLAALAADITSTLRTVFAPLTALPAVGTPVMFYDPTGNVSTAPGASRPLRGTVDAVNGDGSIHLTGTEGHPLGVTVVDGIALGVLYAVPDAIIAGWSLYAPRWERAWSARVAFRAAMRAVVNGDSFRSLEAAMMDSVGVYPYSEPMDTLTF